MPSTVVRFALGLAAALILAAPSSALAATTPPAPEVTTLAPTAVTATGAQLHATVVTHGAPATVHFAYGTAPDQLKLATPDVSVGGGPGTIAVDAPLAGLKPDTRYYVAAVAETADWNVVADVYAFRSLAPPALSPGGVAEITYRSATLHVTLAAHGLPVTIGGTLAGAGRTIAFGPVDAGDGDVAIPLTGLDAGTTYTYVATATSAGGTAGVAGRFETAPLIALPRPRLAAQRVAYGTLVEVSGTVGGRAGLPLQLVEAPSPFTVPVAPVAPVPGLTTTTDAQGDYGFLVRATRTAAYGVTADGAAPPAADDLATLKVFPALTVAVRRASGERTVVTGRLLPRLAARATLHRRGGGRVGPAVTATPGGGFRFPARALRPGTYEVRLAVPAGSGLEPARSRAFTLPRR